MADDRRRPVVPETHPDEVFHRRLLAQRVNSALPKDGSEAMLTPLRLSSFTVATLPDAELWEGAIAHVSDEAGGAVTAFSDGTDWRRVTDRAVVS
ncbi:MAG: hypothetical protein RIB80_04610 [Rhodospirillales bacterium]